MFREKVSTKIDISLSKEAWDIKEKRIIFLKTEENNLEVKTYIQKLVLKYEG